MHASREETLILSSQVGLRPNLDSVALILSICIGSNHAAIGVAAAVLIARVHLAIRASLGVPHVEVNGSFLILKKAMGESLEALR